MKNVVIYNEACVCGVNDKIINSTFYTSPYGIKKDNPSIEINNSKKYIINNQFIQNGSGNQSTKGLLLYNFEGFIENNKFGKRTNQGYSFSEEVYIKDIPSFFNLNIWFSSVQHIYIRWNQFGSSYGSEGVVYLQNIKSDKFVRVFYNDFEGYTALGGIVIINNFWGEISYNTFKNSFVDINNTGTLGFNFENNNFTGYQNKISTSGILRGVNFGFATGQGFSCNKFIATQNNSPADILIQSGSIIKEHGIPINTAFLDTRNEFSTAINIENLGSSFNYYHEGGIYNPTINLGLVSPFLVSTSTNFCLTNYLKSSGSSVSVIPKDVNANLFKLIVNADTMLDSSQKIELLDDYTDIMEIDQAEIDKSNMPCVGEYLKNLQRTKLLDFPSREKIDALKNYLDLKIIDINNWTPNDIYYSNRGDFINTIMKIRNEILYVEMNNHQIQYVADDSFDFEKFKITAREYKNPISEYKIADKLIQQKNFEEAKNVFLNISTLYNLSVLEIEDAMNMARIMELAKTLKNAERTYYEANPAEINSLNEIVNYNTNLASKIACSILNKIGQLCDISNTTILTIPTELVAITYPNPSDGYNVTIEAESLIAKIEVYDSMANKVLETNPNQTYSVLNIENLNLGIYIIKIVGQNGLIKSINYVKE